MVKLTTVLGKWEQTCYVDEAIPGNLYKIKEPKDEGKTKTNSIVVYCVSGTFSSAFVRLSTAALFPLEDSEKLILLPPGTKATLEQVEG